MHKEGKVSGYSPSINKRRLVVIGGGAAGFFCAINAAARSQALEITILEKTSKLLSKVKVSGGGRCNVTHACFDLNEMAARYPRGKNFVRKAFHQFFTTDTIAWFEKKGVALKAEKDGRMFPVTDSSQSIIDCLIKEVNTYGISIQMNAEVKNIKKENGLFQITLTNGTIKEAELICIACGGYPKLSLFQWLTETGHKIMEPVPSLFTFNLPRHPIRSLMGLSVEKARVKIEGSKLSEQGPLLITHWGMSGPAILKLSAWGARELYAENYHFKVHINWLPHLTLQDVKTIFHDLRTSHPSKKIISHHFTLLPHRLWIFLVKESDVTEEMLFGNMSSMIENKIISLLTDYVVEVKGKTTYKEEFVTAGGIQLSEVDNNTMMSKKIENLYFAGEVLDVDGITGGYNFQHAWTSAWIAAKHIAAQ